MFDEKAYTTLLKSMSNTYPKREDGRIDYTNARKAAVLTIYVLYNDKILLLKRSDRVHTYKGKWNTIAGYLDELSPIEKKIHEELTEELQITKDQIQEIKIQEYYAFHDPAIACTWIIYPVLVTLNEKPAIVLDWEHTEYQWIDPRDIENFDTVPNASESLKRCFRI